jgi:hypothetical protein
VQLKTKRTIKKRSDKKNSFESKVGLQKAYEKQAKANKKMTTIHQLLAYN